MRTPTSPSAPSTRVISRLRRKIEHDPHDPELLLTAWGVGYKFADAGDWLAGLGPPR